ncbi:MAG: hypothetical protein LUP95_07105 [Euryarchaeota archaeon]|nr:hypothetical protein [Euryarchaeota archaeon]
MQQFPVPELGAHQRAISKALPHESDRNLTFIKQHSLAAFVDGKMRGGIARSAEECDPTIREFVSNATLTTYVRRSNRVGGKTNSVSSNTPQLLNSPALLSHAIAWNLFDMH